MKLLFIYPGLDPAYPIQLGSLSAYLKRGGHETRLFAPVLKDWHVPDAVIGQLFRELLEFEPDFVAFCGYELALTWIEQFALQVKTYNPRIRTILGGYFPSACPEDAIRSPNIDIICQGEGEAPLLALLNGPHRTDISGLWFKGRATMWSGRWKHPQGGRMDWQGEPLVFELTRNPVAPLISDLDSLPWPDRFHDHQRIINADSGTIKVIAGRGCYYACTYCYAKQMWAHLPDTDKDDYVRLRSPGNVVAELVHLKHAGYQFNRVGFHDDIFWGGHLDWLREFKQRYVDGVGLPFYCAARVEMFNGEVFDLLQGAGCYLLLIGVESGDKAYRKQILRRHMSDEKIRWVVDEARRRKMGVWTFNMVGMLNEGYRSMLATARLNWSLSPDFAMCSVWYPLRGTSMGNEAHEKGLVDTKAAKRVTSYARESVLKYSWGKKRFLSVVRWLNILSACRRPLFWKLVWERLSNTSCI